MNTSMLEYGKIVLSKVSFDEQLFKKEYSKFVKILSHEEMKNLAEWTARNIYSKQFNLIE